MPAAPDHLRKRWRNDAFAIRFLERRGYTLNRDWSWTGPGRPATPDEDSALDYLFLEWDFGDVREGT